MAGFVARIDPAQSTALEAARHDSTRLTPTTWTVANGTLLGVAVGVAIIRLGLRLVYFRRLQLDDFLMLISLVTLLCALGVGFVARDLLFDQVEWAIDIQPVDGNTNNDLSHFLSLLLTLNFLQWATIFLVKLTYLTFFANLVTGLYKMVLWWKFTIVTVCVSAVVCILMPIMTCTKFTGDVLATCSFEDMFANEATWAAVTVAIDIVTDLMIISIPIMVIRRVHLDLKRKFILATVLCLSIVMIIVAVVRIASAFLPGNTTDTVWIMFWQGVEASVAITMVSATGFRSLFGQRRSSSIPANSPTPHTSRANSLARQEEGMAGNENITTLLERRTNEPNFLPRPPSPMSRYTRMHSEEFFPAYYPNSGVQHKALPVKTTAFWDRSDSDSSGLRTLDSDRPTVSHMLSGDTLYSGRSDSVPIVPYERVLSGDIREPEAQQEDSEHAVSPMDDQLLPEKPKFNPVAESRPTTPKVVRFKGGTKEFLKTTTPPPTHTEFTPPPLFHDSSAASTPPLLPPPIYPPPPVPAVPQRVYTPPSGSKVPPRSPKTPPPILKAPTPDFITLPSVLKNDSSRMYTPPPGKPDLHTGPTLPPPVPPRSSSRPASPVSPVSPMPPPRLPRRTGTGRRLWPMARITSQNYGTYRDQ